MQNAYIILALCMASCAIGVIQNQVCPSDLQSIMEGKEAKSSFCSNAFGLVSCLVCLASTFLILKSIFSS